MRRCAPTTRTGRQLTLCCRWVIRKRFMSELSSSQDPYCFCSLLLVLGRGVIHGLDGSSKAIGQMIVP